MTLATSLLLDGALDELEVPATLAEVAADPALRDRYTLYALAGDALRGNPTPDDGFSQRIFARMATESVRMERGYDPLADEG